MAKKKAANKHFVELTQEMLDENPELVEQGYKVGDTMDVEDEEAGNGEDGEVNNSAESKEDSSEDEAEKPKKEAKKAKGPVTKEVKNTVKHNGNTFVKGQMVADSDPNFAALEAAGAF